MNAALCEFWRAARNLVVTVDRVPSDDNVADWPTRDDKFSIFREKFPHAEEVQIDPEDVRRLISGEFNLITTS